MWLGDLKVAMIYVKIDMSLNVDLMMSFAKND